MNSIISILNRDKLSKLAKWIILLLFLFLFLFPLYYIITMSLKNQVDAMSYPPQWIFKPTFDNYYNLFISEGFSKYLINSTIICIICILVSLALGAPMAYALAKGRARWMGFVLFGVLAIRIMPPMSILLPIFRIYSSLKLIDTLTGIVLLYLTITIPLCVWLLRTAFMGIPFGIEEASRIDGCTTWQTFIRICVPIIAEALAATAILMWVYSWNEFLYALVLTRINWKTAPVIINSFIRFEDIKWGTIAAAAVVVSFPVVVFSLLVTKYLVSGLTAGAIKE